MVKVQYIYIRIHTYIYIYVYAVKNKWMMFGQYVESIWVAQSK